VHSDYVIGIIAGVNWLSVTEEISPSTKQCLFYDYKKGE
jgi:hypothetical protein